MNLEKKLANLDYVLLDVGKKNSLLYLHILPIYIVFN